MCVVVIYGLRCGLCDIVRLYGVVWERCGLCDVVRLCGRGVVCVV